MKRNTIGLCAVCLTMLLSACGGGASVDQGCATLDPTRSAALPSCSVTSVAAGVALFTSAPAAVSVGAGGTASYSIGGGVAPYSATSGNTAVLAVSVSGAKLTVNAVSAGTAQVLVLDAAGKSVAIAATVGAAPPLYVTAPPAVTLAVGAGASYQIGGGSAPYVATSSNGAVAGSSVSGSVLTISGAAAGAAQIAIVDASGKSVAVNVTVGIVTALYTTAPAALNVGVGSASSYQVGGGAPPYAASSSNLAAVVASVTGTALNVIGLGAGTAQVALVDAAGKTLVINVTVGTNTSLYTTAPAALSVATGAAPTFVIGGGTPPYLASSSNVGVATAGVSGSTMTISGIAAGTAQVNLTDASGKAVAVAVTVGTVANLFTTAPASISVATGGVPNYSVGGGKPPYTATSSNAAVATASMAGTTLNVQAIAAGAAQVAVVDSAGAAVNVAVTVLPVAATPLDVEPHGATANVGDILNFRVSGGKPGYQITVNNPSVLTVAPSAAASGDLVTATLINAGTSVVTVVDGAGTVFSMTIVVQQATTLMRLSPSVVDVAESFLDPLVFSIYGGKAPYRAFTSDLQKTSVAVNGSLLTVGLGTAGNRCFPIPSLSPPDPHATYDVTITVVDSLGASATGVMRIQDNLATPTCP